jgi:hypothetical protein
VGEVRTGGKTLHRCKPKNKKEEEEEEEGGEPNNQLSLNNNPQATAATTPPATARTTTTTPTTTAKEIASIKAQLLVLVTRLDQLEKKEGKEATRR